MWILSLIGAAFAADCPENADSRLTTRIDDALFAYATVDVDGFMAAHADIESTLPCLTKTISEEKSVKLFQVQGLARWLEEDDARADAAFRSMVLIDPGFQFSSRIAPEGGVLAKRLDSVREWDSPSWSSLDAPDDFKVFINGERTAIRHDQGPSMVQAKARGELVWGGLLGADESLPSILTHSESPALTKVEPEPVPVEEPTPVVKETVEPESVPVASTTPVEPVVVAQVETEVEAEEELSTFNEPERSKPKKKKRKEKKSAGAWVGAVTTGLVAGGLYGTSIYFRGEFDKAPSAQGQTLTNSTFISSMGMSAVSGGLFTFALVRSF